MINFEKAIASAKLLVGNEYDIYWNKFNEDKVEILKVEFLQTYDFIDGNEDFKNKNYDKFVEMLETFDKNALGGKENIKRIHFVKKPVDNYLEMEYYTYLINEKYGQDVRITYDRSLFPKKMYDFVLFKNGNLFILNFGNNDGWHGAWHITDRKIIQDFSLWFNELFDKCVNFKKMITPNKYIIDKMKEKQIID